ncbi:septal ring lytic transglycosylase RlpA family protein [Aquaticitalea lipolytica]|uniref:septal ring lytic transglycosylase RlpA family protein n=1 Tax=Aquaticitalea lipolytica TaxID=1247562 RepID=UPI0024BBC485|nr:septal ring lytic transglycosylase RlpA family protein [Aquaticitalea lipolytica]
MKLLIKTIVLLGFLILISSFKSRQKKYDIIETKTDTTSVDSSLVAYKLYKENAHASYYHDKFNGRKTASGEKFDNNLYTAAHKTLKFGTKIRVTNTVNDSSVIVTVNDRGPFVKGRELDLSKKAFMEIAKFKQRGHLIVNIEIIED